jgi:hypothetical protein
MKCFAQKSQYDEFIKESNNETKQMEILRLVILATGELNNDKIMNHLDDLTSKELTKLLKKIDKIWELITEL